MRVLRFFFNTLVYGTGYAVLNDLIHRPQPLDEEKSRELFSSPGQRPTRLRAAHRERY
jgi:hypothetical protein